MIEEDGVDLLLLSDLVPHVLLLGQPPVLSRRQPNLQPDRALDVGLGRAA